MAEEKSPDENVILLDTVHPFAQSKLENLNVDEILDHYVGACGIWQWGISVMAVLAAPAMATFPVFVNAVPDFRCKMETNVEHQFQQHNLTFGQVKAIVGSSELEASKSRSGCSRFQLDWTNETLVENLILNQSWSNHSNRIEMPQEPCPAGYIYQPTKFQYPGSIVAEFDLVCNNNWLAPMGTSLFMLGMLIGFVTGGWFGDKFGRRRAALGFSLVEIVISIGVSLAPNHHVYHLMRTIIGITNTGKAGILRILPMELTLAKYRSYFTSFTMIGVLFAHRALMAGVAYLVPNWRYLNAILTIPCLACLLFFCFLPESPRWLCSQAKYTEALQVLRRGCYVNNWWSKSSTKLHDFDLMISNLEHLRTTTSDGHHSKSKILKQPKKNFKQKLPSLGIVTTVLICTFVIAIQSFCLFGLILYGRSIKDYIYLVAFINSTMAIPGPIIAGIAYRIFRYRRIPLIIIYSISMIALLLGGLYTVLGQPETDLILNICFNFALMLSTAGTIMCMIYVAELFPSNVRATATGISSGFGRIGSMVSTFVNQLETYTIHGIPILIYAGGCLVQLVLLSLLKDTSGENLPDTYVEMRLRNPDPMESSNHSIENLNNQVTTKKTNDNNSNL